VARFLSDEWFDEVAAASPPPAAQPILVLQQVVTGGPDGDVRYQVTVGDGRAVLTRDHAGSPDATFTEAYSTAVAVARGELTTQAALLAGQIVVGGNMATLSDRQDDLAGLEAIPTAVRAAMTF
jgi:putative sterol carrier protein